MKREITFLRNPRTSRRRCLQIKNDTIRHKEKGRLEAALPFV